jgi:hypothetical protein
LTGRRGGAWAFGIAAACIAFQAWLQRDDLVRYDQQVLPAFDAYVYMAMADHPGVFTVGPWGYRLATPALVHALPLPTATGFAVVTFSALVLSGGLLFLFLRRLGYAETPALICVAAFGLSPPIAASAGYVFLVDPLTLLLQLVLLVVLESGAGLGTLALVFALGALTKEVFLLYLPVVFFARWDRDGPARAALKLFAATAAAFAATASVHAWTPYLVARSAGLPDADTFWLAVYRILAGWRPWLGPALLWGILPLAVLGGWSARSRLFLRRYGFLIALTLALPFAASVYTDDRRTVPFFAEDVPRLLLFAVPLLLPLALNAFGRFRPAPASDGVPAWPRAAEAAAALVALGVVLAPLWLLDPYRRVDLRGPRDGRLLLALCRESVAFAQRFDRGKPIAYSPEGRRFSPDRSDPHLLERMRWYLRDGWGRMPHYEMGPVVMTGREASVLLPCLRPAEWEIVLTMSAAQAGLLRVEVNGRAIGEIRPEVEPVKARLRVPADVLFRGDNVLRLVADGVEAPAARLRGLLVKPLS